VRARATGRQHPDQRFWHRSGIEALTAKLSTEYKVNVACSPTDMPRVDCGVVQTTEDAESTGPACIRIISTEKKSLSLIAPRLCQSLVHGRSERADPYTLEKMRNFSDIGGAAIWLRYLPKNVLKLEAMTLARLATRGIPTFRKRGATFPVRLRHVVAMAFFAAESELR